MNEIQAMAQRLASLGGDLSEAQTSAANAPTEVANPCETDNGDAVPAVMTGNDRMLERGGSRILLRNDGVIIVDARQKGGPIRIQSGGKGAVITANGATITIGADGKTIQMTCDTLVISAVKSILLDSPAVRLAGRAARAVLGDPLMAWLFGHTHPVAGTATLAPNAKPPLSTVLSDNVTLS